MQVRLSCPLSKGYRASTFHVCKLQTSFRERGPWPLVKTRHILKGKAAPCQKQEGAPAINKAAAAPAVPPETHWRPLDVPPPALPADYKPLVDVTLPCSVYTFYSNVLSQKSDFLKQEHEQIDRVYDYVKRAWWPTPINLSDYPDAQDQSKLQGMGRTVFDLVLGAGSSGGFTRTITFVNPCKPPNRVDAHCVQRQQFAVYQGNVLVMAAAMDMLNIPFKDCFMVFTAWRVEPGADAQTCKLTIVGKIHFVKGTMMSGIIRATALRDLGSFHKALGVRLQERMASVPAVANPSGSSTVKSFGWRASPTSQPRASSSQPSTESSRTHWMALSADGAMLAETMPSTRQLRILLVLLMLLASIIHQIFLRHELFLLQEQLKNSL